MAEAPFSDDDSGSSLKFFSSSHPTTSDDSPAEPFKELLDEDNLVPSKNEKNSPLCCDQITESLDHLSTKSDRSSDDSEVEEHFRKKARVGNHYQARIPKYSANSNEDDSEDELLWDPFIMDSDSVETFLKRISSISKLVIPMGTHLRDDEEALYILQKNRHDVESALKIFSTNKEKRELWSEEECRNFEKGIMNFGKNFFLIQKYKVNTRHVGELVQFYYLWKKTERYDLFANRMRTGKKKYSLNPGISDLMCRYLKRQGGSPFSAPLSTDVQLIVTDSSKDVAQSNSQY